MNMKPTRTITLQVSWFKSVLKNLFPNVWHTFWYRGHICALFISPSCIVHLLLKMIMCEFQVYGLWVYWGSNYLLQDLWHLSEIWCPVLPWEPHSIIMKNWSFLNSWSIYPYPFSIEASLEEVSYYSNTLFLKVLCWNLNHVL